MQIQLGDQYAYIYSAHIRIIHKPLVVGLFFFGWMHRPYHWRLAYWLYLFSDFYLFIKYIYLAIQFLLSVSLQPRKKEWNRGYRYIDWAMRIKVRERHENFGDIKIRQTKCKWKLVLLFGTITGVGFGLLQQHASRYTIRWFALL